jgi:hypothetical protein
MINHTYVYVLIFKIHIMKSPSPNLYRNGAVDDSSEPNIF